MSIKLLLNILTKDLWYLHNIQIQSHTGINKFKLPTSFIQIHSFFFLVLSATIMYIIRWIGSIVVMCSLHYRGVASSKLRAKSNRFCSVKEPYSVNASH